MASLKFYLNKPNSKEKTSILFRLSYGAYKMDDGKKQYLGLRYFTTESIDPVFWNTKTGRVKESRKFPQYPEFNARLQSIEDTALNILRKLQNDNITVNNDVLKSEFDKVFKDSKDLSSGSSGQMEFMDYVDHFIKTSDRKEGTKKSYIRSYRDYQEYESSRKIKLTFDKIDIDFYNDFIQFLKSKNYAPNTIGTRVKNLKTFLSNANDSGYTVNGDFRKKAFAKPKEETDAIYLSENELKAIYNLDLSKKPKLDRARDLFLIGAYTGLRFSDFSQIDMDNINNNIITRRAIKTEKTISIPLHVVVASIFKKYTNCLPKTPSNQKFNEYIKEVAKLAKIKEPIKIEQTRGNMRVNKTVPKHDLVTSHTARRSFATNAFLSDVPAISIMKITGHKTESAFMKYIKISSEDNARKLLEHEFFKRMIVSVNNSPEENTGS